MYSKELLVNLYPDTGGGGQNESESSSGNNNTSQPYDGDDWTTTFNSDSGEAGGWVTVNDDGEIVPWKPD